MNGINWTKWSSIAEIVSSIAVLLTLVYLAVQTNQIAKQTELNTSAILSNSRQESLNAELSMLYKFIDYPPQTLVEGRGVTKEQYREGILYQSIFRIRENLWFQYRSGVLDENNWETYRDQMVLLLNYGPQMRQTWENTKNGGGYDPEFISEIETLLDDIN